MEFRIFLINVRIEWLLELVICRLSCFVSGEFLGVRSIEVFLGIKVRESFLVFLKGYLEFYLCFEKL